MYTVFLLSTLECADLFSLLIHDFLLFPEVQKLHLQESSHLSKVICWKIAQEITP